MERRMTDSTDWCDLQLSKRLQSRHRTFQLDIHLRSAHRRIVLTGPSGIGKTMLLRCVAGLMTPDAGHIRLRGATLYDSRQGVNLPPRSRRVGFLFQDYALLPHLTALSNVGFGLHRGPWGFLSRKQKALAMAWLERFHLDHVAHQYPHTLSGGQQQRLALARLAILQPRVLLLDEPFAALDPDLRSAMRSEVATLLDTLDIPLLMVSHDEEDGRALQATRIRLGQADGRTVVID